MYCHPLPQPQPRGKVPSQSVVTDFAKFRFRLEGNYYFKFDSLSHWLWQIWDAEIKFKGIFGLDGISLPKKNGGTAFFWEGDHFVILIVLKLGHFQDNSFWGQRESSLRRCLTFLSWGACTSFKVCFERNTIHISSKLAAGDSGLFPSIINVLCSSFLIIYFSFRHNDFQTEHVCAFVKCKNGASS